VAERENSVYASIYREEPAAIRLRKQEITATHVGESRARHPPSYVPACPR
jgi:hypothetical protein